MGQRRAWTISGIGVPWGHRVEVKPDRAPHRLVLGGPFGKNVLSLQSLGSGVT